MARTAASEPAPRGARARRGRARRAAGPRAHALSGRPARAARHARHAHRDGDDVKGHRRRARKLDRSAGDPRVARRAREGARLRVRHVDRRGGDVGDARLAVGALPARAARRRAGTRREDRDDAARAFARASARRNLPAAAAAGRPDADARRPAAGDDAFARAAERRLGRAADRQPAGISRQGRGNVRASRFVGRPIADGQRRGKRAGGRLGAAARDGDDDGRARARDGRAARCAHAGRAAPARRAVGRIRDDGGPRRGRLASRARRSSALERRARAAPARLDRADRRIVRPALHGFARRRARAPRRDGKQCVRRVARRARATGAGERSTRRAQPAGAGNGRRDVRAAFRGAAAHDRRIAFGSASNARIARRAASGHMDRFARLDRREARHRVGTNQRASRKPPANDLRCARAHRARPLRSSHGVRAAHRVRCCAR